MKLEPFPGSLTYEVIERPFITKTGKEGRWRGRVCVLTDEQREWLRRWFPEEENARLLSASGMSHSMLHRFARIMHLVKSVKGMSRIKKRQAQKIKRMCERNGYYDSLRGRQPSEACREATARMWQDIREGRREHPFATMAREHPRKYRQFMRRKSIERSEAIRKEKLRVFYGMNRKTRLTSVVMCRYTRSQVNHRYNALQRGYILADECHEGSAHRYTIYYDSQTPRAPIFERNLQRDGFTLKPWPYGE